MKGFESVMNIGKFIRDAEEVCFDCGSSEKQLTNIHPGISLCPTCLKSAMEDYDLKQGGKDDR